MMPQIRILYEDEEILVCQKPGGIPVQTKKFGLADMESLLKNYRADKGEDAYIATVHRLDLPVSGVMVFAKTKTAATSLCRQFAVKRADKFYCAMVEGIPPKKKDTLVDWLKRDGKTNISAVVPAGEEGAKRAELSYEVLEAANGKAILWIRLSTGRHHQIRVQLAHAGYPIVGDKKYNFRENIAPSADMPALCACRLVFRHPTTLKKMEFEVEKPFEL